MKLTPLQRDIIYRMDKFIEDHPKASQRDLLDEGLRIVYSLPIEQIEVDEERSRME